MNPYSISPLICSLFALSLGLFVLSKNFKSPINRSFALLSYEAFHWEIAWFLSFYLETEIQLNLCAKASYTTIIFLPFTYYHFAVHFLGRYNKDRKKVRAFYLFGLFWLILLWTTDLFISGHHKFNWGVYSATGLLHPFYILSLGIAVIFVVKNLLERIRNEEFSATIRNYAKFILLSFLLFACASIEFLINYGIDFYPIGVYFILASFSVIAFAIVKYNLMGIEVAFKEALAKVLSFAMLSVAAYFTVASILKIVNVTDMHQGIILSLLTMSVFYSLHRKFSDKISHFLRPRQDLDETFRRYTETEIIGSHNVKELADLIVKTVSDSLKPKVCSLMLLDKQNRLYNVVASSVMDEEIKSIAFKESNHLISTLKNNYVKLIVKDELNKILSEEDAKLVRRDLDILNAQLCLPLRLKEELVGLLSLGARASGELYTPEEMGFIFVFTTQSAMMISFLEEIGEFERKLIYAEKLAGMTNLLDGFNHEIRNQMGTVQFYIANAHKPELKEDMKNYRNIALDAFESIVMILDSVQGYRETSEIEETTLTDIKEEINSAVTQLKLKFDKIKAKITTHIPDNLPQLETYPSFKYLFSNILHNSYYALSQRKTRLLDIKVSQPDDFKRPIQIVISDTGGDLLKVMDKQERSSGGEYFPERATVGGINYFLAKHIVDDHQGKLEISTNTATEEKGTIFTIRLPLKQPKS